MTIPTKIIDVTTEAELLGVLVAHSDQGFHHLREQDIVQGDVASMFLINHQGLLVQVNYRGNLDDLCWEVLIRKSPNHPWQTTNQITTTTTSSRTTPRRCLPSADTSARITSSLSMGSHARQGATSNPTIGW